MILLITYLWKILFLQALFQSAQHLYEKREGSLSGSGSVPLTNGSWSGSLMPKKHPDPDPQHYTRLNSSCSSSPLQMPFWKGGPGQAAPVLGAHRLRPLQAHPSCLRRGQHQQPDESLCQAPSQLQSPGQCWLVSPPEGAARNGTADDGGSRQHGVFPKTEYFYLA